MESKINNTNTKINTSSTLNTTTKFTPMQTKRLFYHRFTFKQIITYLDEPTQKILKIILRKSGLKDKKKQLKEIIKNYIIDFGKHNEKLNYGFLENGKIALNTNIFNINKKYLKEMKSIYYEETEDIIELDRADLYSYLKVLPKFTFNLINDNDDKLKLSKAVVPFDHNPDDNIIDEESENDPNKKYEMFYSDNNDIPIDFSNKEYLIERQKRILEKMNLEKEKVYYPLEFISSVNYWSIILCHGGYFAVGFFLKDSVLDHKSDHKYVTRKKAGQRQITKDKSGKLKSSGKFKYNIFIKL